MADSATAADLDKIFEELYKEHYRPLVRFFGHRGLDSETSRDLAQDTMQRAYQSLDEFEGRSKLKTWLMAIATNVWKNWVRDHRSTAKRDAREDSLDAAHEAGVEVGEGHGLWPRPSTDPERRILETEGRERIRTGLVELATRQRQCLELWLEGYEYQEIADRLGTSLQTVRASLSRGKRRLTEELGLGRPPGGTP